MVGGSSSEFFELDGEVVIDVMVVMYCTYVEFWELLKFCFEKLKFMYVGFKISTECTFSSTTCCVTNQND